MSNSLRDTASELADLVDDIVLGNYTPDSFTTQPIRAALLDSEPLVLTSQRGRGLAHAKAWLCKRWNQEHPNEQHIIQLADYAEALATQPATSQEGRGCEKCQWSGLERFVGYGNSEETLPCSFCSPATTPTLPTATSQEAEADRLREALEEIDRINGGADWNGTRTIARAALARAQVKAS